MSKIVGVKLVPVQFTPGYGTILYERLAWAVWTTPVSLGKCAVFSKSGNSQVFEFAILRTYLR